MTTTPDYTVDHQSLTADEIPLASTSEAAIATDAAAALAYLTRRDALDLAPMLGLVAA